MSELNNIYYKIQSVRCALQDLNLKKSGDNKFAGYKYYELADFLPAVNQLLLDYKLMAQVSFTPEVATMTVINAENPAEKVIFTSPMAEASLKGAHAIQNLGAVETYQRRYLYMSAFEIVENDGLDAALCGSDKRQNQEQKQQAKAGLSDKARKQLNDKVASYKALTGASDVHKALCEALGKTREAFTDADAQKAVGIIDKWTEAYNAGNSTGTNN